MLWPPKKPLVGADINRNSLVLKIRHDEKSMLLMGDAGVEAEHTLLKEGKLGVVDLLIVGHHGADDATSKDFLEIVQPKEAVISTNADNFRGYPSSDVLKRLEAAKVKVYRTALEGELAFEF
ncbi:MAG TPA: hypothetical protein VJ974_05580 [Geopsychrobacteraceae bacterium]|nr:hypothetical protein [Geopsychrobacteraceae bacterium]